MSAVHAPLPTGAEKRVQVRAMFDRIAPRYDISANTASDVSSTHGSRGMTQRMWSGSTPCSSRCTPSPWWDYHRSATASHTVAESLQCFGYRIIPVRPAVESVLGEKAYAELRNLPETPDLVDVFRAPEHVGPIVDECIELAIKAIWLQDGVINEESALKAQQAGIIVIMDRYIYRDYMRLMPQ